MLLVTIDREWDDTFFRDAMKAVGSLLIRQ